MNYRIVAQQTGLLLLVLSTIMLATAASVWGFLLAGFPVSGSALTALLVSAGVGAVTGGATWIGNRNAPPHLGRREALLLVALSWIVGAALAALPFFLWAHLDPAQGTSPFRGFDDCYFEAMSGLTTTGATVLSDIDALPPSLLFWRSMTHWLGGLGIVVLFVAVLPSLGTGGKKMFRVEATGPAQEGVRPHIRETARVLWYIYLGITAATTLSMWLLSPMTFFESVCHALSLVSTGGLSTSDASLGAWDSVALDYLSAFFMTLAGVNFAIYYAMVRGKWSVVKRDVELRVYLVLKVAVILLVMVNLHGERLVSTAGKVVEAAGLGESLRQATFATVTWQTGTGFGISDYDLWPGLSKALLVGLMFIGGCAGSTAGGVKVVRFWVALKVMLGQLEKAYRPSVVRPIRVGGSALDPEITLGCIAYLVGFFFVVGIGAFIVHFSEPAGSTDAMTTMTASLSCLSNVGPGLGGVGATQNYGWMSIPSKLVLSVLMALGRLEFFAILVLFTPRFWRGN